MTALPTVDQIELVRVWVVGDMTLGSQGCRSAWTMHSGFIGSVHTLSPWTPPGLNNGAVSARPAPTCQLAADHHRRKDSLSVPDQRKRRRRM